MSTFPSLSVPPGYPLDPDGTLEDATIRSESTAGYEQSRPRYTRARRSFGVRYQHLADADVAVLRAFELTTLRNGSDLFTWMHPVTAIPYTVRLAGPIAYARTVAPGISDVSMTLREV